MTQNESFKLLPRPALPVENCSFVTHRTRDEMKEKVQQKSRRLKAEYLRDGGEEKEKKDCRKSIIIIGPAVDCSVKSNEEGNTKKKQLAKTIVPRS